MKKHISLFLVLTIVLSMVSIISHFDDPVSAGSTFCADSFAVTKADGTVVHEFGSNSNLGQLEDYVDDGAVNIHAAGWYLPESAMEDMGYQHDDGAITWGIAYVDSSIYGPLNSELPMRYRFDTPILEGTHTFRIVARLTSGKIVTAFETHYINGYSIVAEWVNINTGDDGAGLGLWLWAPGEYAAAAFTATDSFEGLCTPICWASRTDNDQPVTYEMLVYRFVNNIENSMSKTPLVRQEYAPEGDNGSGDAMEFEPLPGGQYVLAIRLLTVENGGYFVLPTNGNSEKAVYKTNVGDGTQTFNFGIKTTSNNSIFGVPPVITFYPVIAVSSADGYFGDEVTLEVAISNNPGIIAMSIDVNYDADVLELISAMPKDFNDMSFGPTANQPFKVTWDGSLSPNNTQNGVLVELKFAIKEGAALGDTAVTISYDEDNIFNSNYDNVAFGVTNGVVTVKEIIIEPPTPAPEITIAACNLSFQDNIYIKYAVKTDDLTAIKLLIWTAPQTEYVYGTHSAELTTIGTETVSGVQCAIFQYNKLAAKQMTDNVYARAFIEIDGVNYYSEVKKYSILQYACNKTGRTGTATSNQKLITLLNDMLQYGASAQNYLNYKLGRLATMDFYQVKVVGGLLSDMCDNGLYLTGESVVLTAPATNAEGLPFVCWQDSSENIVGTETTLTITVGTANEVYTAVFGNVIDYSLFEFESNGDGTCVITALNAHDSNEIVLPDKDPNGDVVTGIDAGAFASEDITVITIPVSITTIGRNAFKGCDQLTDVYYTGTQEQWEAIEIASGNSVLSTAIIHYNAVINNGQGSNETPTVNDSFFDSWNITTRGTFTSPKQCTVSLAEDGIKFTCNASSNADPSVYFNIAQYSSLTGRNPLKGEDGSYIVFKIKADDKCDGNFEIFTQSPRAGDSGTAQYYADGNWHYVLVDMTSTTLTNTNNLTTIRIDWSSINTKNGAEFTISEIAFCDNYEDAMRAAGLEEYLLKPANGLTENDPLADNTLTAPDEEAGVMLWFEQSTAKIYQNKTGNTSRTGYTVRMAKNEAENAQFFVAPGRDMKVRVEVDEFSDGKGHTVPFELCFEYYHNISGSMIPDALPPYTGARDVAAGKTQGFVIRLTTSPDTPAGTYSSIVHIFDDDTGKEVKRASVAVKVWNFALSEETELRTAFALWASYLYNSYNHDRYPEEYLWEQDIEGIYYDFFLKYRINIMDMPHGLTSSYAAAKMLDPRVNTARWTSLDMSIKDDNNGVWPDWMDKVFYYTVDEPGSRASVADDLAKLLNDANRIRANTPNYRMVVPFERNPDLTSDGKATTFEMSEIDMIGYMQQAVNIWCPKLDAFTPRALMFIKNSASVQSMQQDLRYGTFPERMKARVAAGDELWAYIAINPTQPYVNWQLLSDGTEAITSIWQLKMLNVTGLLYWAVDYWKVNYWGSSPWTGSNYGDGMLVYSGYAFDLLEPIPTLRLESIRDGIEDYQMLCMLEELLGREAVDDIIHRITTSVVTYTKDDDYIHAVRILLGDTLELAVQGDAV